ncbi:hypothetical protein [Bradyrhizobium prioriisuperbiae]|uniref:hypothetical protein n=1 Tax=Bradyrhizobium prioriisuperbiae TaxID=2854389 RepID=UPI0028E809B8|nr:hypothetical protein [Bradyrhizobium prioritasuperba]
MNLHQEHLHQEHLHQEHQQNHHQLAGKTREIIRLWNTMRSHEREMEATELASDRACSTLKVLDIRRELQRALAERDRLVEASRNAAS